MKSGDVKRGADVEVGLVREQVMSELTKASLDFKTSYGQTDAAYREAKAKSDQAYEADLRNIRSGFSRSTDSDEALARTTEAAGRVDAVRKEWLDRSAKLLKGATVKVTRTDVNGHYEFKSVSRGKYYILASHTVFDNNLFWLVPIEIHDAHSVDLSNSNAGAPLDLLREEGGSASTSTNAPVSPPPFQEKPHQPKWLVEQLAKEKSEAEERQRTSGTREAINDTRPETNGTWRLQKTLFKRKVSNGWTPDSVLGDVLKNPEQFQSQAVVASSLSKDECHRVANDAANASRNWGDKRSDAEDGVVLIRRSERESADASGWTRNSRVEESVTVLVWSCGNAVSESTNQRSAALPVTRSAR